MKRSGTLDRPLRKQPVSPGRLSRLAAGVALAAAGAAPAAAYTFDTGTEVNVQINTTIKYSVGLRTAPQDPGLLSIVNGDDGDRAFSQGNFISNRLDGLTELIVKYHDIGFDVSGDGWYDFQYNRNNSNTSPLTFNPVSVAHRTFPTATQDIEGRYAELGNAFGYWNGHVGDLPLRVRVGRYSLIWGESLFAADNGIAYGMEPIDIIKAASVPNTQAKELFLPVAQASFSLQLTPKLSLEAYSQFEWRKSRLPAADSYFSPAADLLDAGGERILVGPPLAPVPGFGPAAFFRGRDDHPTGLGQFGVALRYRPTSALDLGFYALQFNDKSPQVYVEPGVGFNAQKGQIGEYILGYQKHIQIYGMSASTSYGNINYGAEVSVRRNNDFQAAANVVTPGSAASFGNNPLYPVGDSLQYQVNAIWLMPAKFGFDSATLLSELQGSHILSIYENANNLSPNARHTTLGLRSLYDPSLYQVLPGLDLDFPLGFGWNFQGRSATTAVFNNTNNAYGGDISIGASFVYNNVWRGGLSYTRYIAGKSVANDTYALAPFLDRDFVSFNFLRSF